MVRIYLVILLIVAAFFLLRRLLNVPPALIARTIRILVISVIVLAVTYFVATGRLNWLFALIGLVMASLTRLLPVLLRYAPILQQLWFDYLLKRRSGHTKEGSFGNKSQMSKDEACEVLGVAKDASRQEIISAHKRLIQKCHPDRGGSVYLAARINLAKKTLLG